jgi:hypothetical protein
MIPDAFELVERLTNHIIEPMAERLIERAAWAAFFCAALPKVASREDAADFADDYLTEYRKRFK